jgi:hypothetical protein
MEYEDEIYGVGMGFINSPAEIKNKTEINRTINPDDEIEKDEDNNNSDIKELESALTEAEESYNYMKELIKESDECNTARLQEFGYEHWLNHRDDFSVEEAVEKSSFIKTIKRVILKIITIIKKMFSFLIVILKKVGEKLNSYTGNEAKYKDTFDKIKDKKTMYCNFIYSSADIQKIEKTYLIMLNYFTSFTKTFSLNTNYIFNIKALKDSLNPEIYNAINVYSPGFKNVLVSKNNSASIKELKDATSALLRASKETDLLFNAFGVKTINSTHELTINKIFGTYSQINKIFAFHKIIEDITNTNNLNILLDRMDRMITIDAARNGIDTLKYENTKAFISFYYMYMDIIEKLVKDMIVDENKIMNLLKFESSNFGGENK